LLNSLLNVQPQAFYVSSTPSPGSGLWPQLVFRNKKILKTLHFYLKIKRISGYIPLGPPHWRFCVGVRGRGHSPPPNILSQNRQWPSPDTTFNGEGTGTPLPTSHPLVAFGNSPLSPSPLYSVNAHLKLGAKCAQIKLQSPAQIHTTSAAAVASFTSVKPDTHYPFERAVRTVRSNG